MATGSEANADSRNAKTTDSGERERPGKNDAHDRLATQAASDKKGGTYCQSNVESIKVMTDGAPLPTSFPDFSIGMAPAAEKDSLVLKPATDGQAGGAGGTLKADLETHSDSKSLQVRDTGGQPKPEVSEDQKWKELEQSIKDPKAKAELQKFHQHATEAGLIDANPDLIDNIKAFAERSKDFGGTFHQLNRLYESKLTPPVNHNDRDDLAACIIRDAAHPQAENQGKHDTCGPTNTRRWLMENTPEVAAKMAVDAVTSANGAIEYTGIDGKTNTIHLDPKSMHEDGEASDCGMTPSNGHTKDERDYLGQIMDHVMINAALQVNDPDLRYTQGEKDGNHLTGEHVTKNGVDQGAMFQLHPDQLGWLNHTFEGRQGSVIADKSNSDSDDYQSQFVQKTDSADNLWTRLQSTDHPTLLVHLDSALYGQHEGKNNDGHYIGVVGSKTDEQGHRLVHVTNQWGDNGKLQDAWVPVEQLYGAMKDPYESQRVAKGT